MKLLCPRSLCGRESGAAGLHCQWHWLELCRLGEWKGPWGTEQMVLGAAQAWVRQWFFLQRAVLWMVSASELFFIKMGSENICNNFYSTCIHGRLFFCKVTS